MAATLRRPYRITVELTPPEFEAVERRAHADDCSRAAIVRASVRAYVGFDAEASRVRAEVD